VRIGTRRLGIAWRGVLLAAATAIPAASQVDQPRPPRLSFLPEVVDETPPRPGADRTETIRFKRDFVVDTLANLQLGTPVEFDDWPIAPGVRRRMAVRRVEPFSQEPTVFMLDGRGEARVAPAQMVFLEGRDLEGPDEAALFVAIDPSTRDLYVSSRWLGEEWYLDQEKKNRKRLKLHRMEPPQRLAQERGGRLSPVCDQGRGDLEPMPAILPRPAILASLEERKAPEIFPTLQELFVSIEADAQFIQLFPSGKAAEAYITAAVAELNSSAFTTLGPNVRLTIGSLFLHAAEPDGFNASAGASTTAKLLEFRDHFQSQHGADARGAAILFTGRLSSGIDPAQNLLRGNSWIEGLCTTDKGYAVIQASASGGYGETANVHWLLGHELGHLFGARHSHCPTPNAPFSPIDSCYNTQGDCFDGAFPTNVCPVATAEFPAGGSLMSMCSANFGSENGGCTSNLRFHPRTLSGWIDPFLQTRPATCISPYLSFQDVWPRSGPLAGGNLVRISGAAFSATTQVYFNGLPASVQSWQANAMDVLVPAASTSGQAQVEVRDVAPSGVTRSRFRFDRYFYADDTAPLNYVQLPTACRALDSRGNGAPIQGGAFQPGERRNLTLTGVCGIPATAKAVSFVTTVIDPGGIGFLQFVPGNAGDLNVSTVNFLAGETVAGNTITRLATNGTGTLGVAAGCNCTLHATIDINGYFQ
jgi:hypothetical protein